MATKWKLIVDTELIVNDELWIDEVSEYIYSLQRSGQYDVKWYPEGNFFTGYSPTGDSPHGAIDLIPRQWKWEYKLDMFENKDWIVRVITKGLEAKGHTNISFNPQDNSFTGSATEEVELPPNAIVDIYWQWKCELTLEDKEWEIRLVTEGLKGQGYTQVKWNPDENAFQGIASGEMELPPSAIILK